MKIAEGGGDGKVAERGGDKKNRGRRWHEKVAERGGDIRRLGKEVAMEKSGDKVR